MFWYHSCWIIIEQNRNGTSQCYLIWMHDENYKWYPLWSWDFLCLGSQFQKYTSKQCWARPNQLVFVRNVNLSSVLNNEMPALESFTKSDIVRMNLDAMHKARGNFIKAESSERIRRALRHKVRTYPDQQYENGEQVLYKRKDTKGWKEPGAVLGQDGQYILIRHASAYYRVHPYQLIKKRHPRTTGTNIEECDDGTIDHRPSITVEEIDSEIDNAHKSTTSELPNETSTENTTPIIMINNIWLTVTSLILQMQVLVYANQDGIHL